MSGAADSEPVATGEEPAESGGSATGEPWRPYLPPPAPPLPDEVERDEWHRLNPRMIAVDLAQVVLAALPALIAIVVVGVDAEGGGFWPLIGLAAWGALGAFFDVLRWLFTRFRVTDSHVELKTGVLFRVHRSIQQDRIRSVDAEAKLRHRIAGLRVVIIGAGQQKAAGESALKLDAVSVADARALQRDLLDPKDLARATDPAALDDDRPAVATEDAATGREPTADGDASPAEQRSQDSPRDEPLAVFARFEPGWAIYNVLNLWTYVIVGGLGWGGVWLLDGFGIDVVGFVGGLIDWDAIGWLATVAIAFAAATVFGVLALAVVYVTEYWGFELARVRGQEGTLLRTRQGLFTTREVNRAESRIRGIQLSEPLLWRWMRVADTTVVTTGLNLWAITQPAAILPRAPVTAARRVAGEVLGTEDPAHPFLAQLAPRPFAALRRRLFWASAIGLAVALVLLWLALTDVVPFVAVAAAAVVWPLALLGAWIAYRALGHAVVGRYLVTRSGLFNRATTALQCDAVSTVVVRESLLQRRLGLRSLLTMTAAGYGTYATPDLDANETLELASRVAPELLAPFVVRDPR